MDSKRQGPKDRSRKNDAAKQNKSKSTAKKRQRKEGSEAKWRETAFIQGGDHVGSHLS